MSFGSIVFILIGVAFLVAGVLLAKSKQKRKSTVQRLQDMFADYDKEMDKFRR